MNIKRYSITSQPGGFPVYPASIGKTFCAVAVLLLVKDGLVDLDAPVVNYLSEDILDGFQNGNAITVRQLLNHSSRLSNLDWNEQFLSDVFNDPFGISTRDLLQYERNTGFSNTPGTKFKYSSTGYEILAELVEKITGNHALFYSQRIFEALDLRHTYYKNESSYPVPANLVNSYFDRFDNERIENISKVNNHLTSVFTGSDGVISTPWDLYASLNGIIEGPLLSDELRMLMLDFQPT